MWMWKREKLEVLMDLSVYSCSIFLWPVINILMLTHSSRGLCSMTRRTVTVGVLCKEKDPDSDDQSQVWPRVALGT